MSFTPHQALARSAAAGQHENRDWSRIMPNATYMPRREADLISFCAVFSDTINADPEAYGLTPAQAARFAALLSAFINAWERLQDPRTRTTPNTQIKHAARDALINDSQGVRELVAIIKSHPGITSAQLAELQLTIADEEHTPIHAPDQAPELSILSITGRTIHIRLKDRAHPTRRGKPRTACGATVLYHVGDEASSQPSDWAFAMNTSKTNCSVHIPACIPAGQRIWLTAHWFNAKMETSPAATAKCACISDGLSPLSAAA